MTEQTLLIALVAAQFYVHALGWSMAALASGRWRDTEGQFAAFWLVLAIGLLLYVQSRAPGGTPRNVSSVLIDTLEHLNLPLAILVLFVGGLVNLLQLRLILGRVLQHLTTEARTDALTGTANRRGLMRYLDEVHARSLEGDHPYVLMMVDIDHFKAINDQHGHAEGDRVIKRIAQALRDGLRVDDFVARWGGEEFCVLMPRIGLVEARALAERLTLQVAASGQPRVTISIGVAEAHAQSEVPEAAIRRADAAMYRAKQSGRNQVVNAVAAIAV